MKPTISTLVFLFLFTQNSFSQYNTPLRYTSTTFVYKITDEEAKTIYTEKADHFKSPYFEKYCYNLLDSFPNPMDEVNYPYDFGYYLKIKTLGEKNYVEVKAIHDISVKEMDDEDEFVFQVFDSSYQLITDAKAFFEDKEIEFDTATNTFRRKSKKEKGLITIQANGQTVYYDYNSVKNEKIRKRRYRYGYFSFRRIGYRIIRPFTSNGIFVYSFKKVFMKPHKGYIAVNQPKYRHNDTVRVKAYITKPNGKPINKDMEVMLYENGVNSYSLRYQKPVSKATVENDLDGNYKHEFVLGDSLKIDKMYYTIFVKKTNRKRKKIYFQQGFMLEDYELDKVDYSFEPTQNEYNAPQKIILKAAAKDQNNNYIPDGTLKITVSTQNVIKFYEDSLRVKDELWKTTTEMKHNGETQVIIPWDTIPPVKINVQVVADMYNSSGEFQRFTKYLILDNKPTVLKARQEGEYLVVELLKDNKSIEGEAIMTKFVNKVFPQQTTLPAGIKEETIQLPFKEKINPIYAKYDFRDKVETISFVPENSGISWSGINEADSIQLQMQNTFGLPVFYEIYKLNKLVAEGETTEKQFSFGDKNSKGTTYTVIYKYLWKGAYQQEQREFVRYKDVLKIVIDQPEMVLPSQNLPVAIKVTDSENKPVSNVNLTAMAINTAFGNTSHYTEPRAKSPERKKNNRRKYNSTFSKINKNYVSAYNSSWYKRFGLDQNLYHRVRFPKDGVLMEYSKADQDTFYLKYAQFAPFVVKDGVMQNISMIFCNNQIVYYAGALQTRPYSFVGQEGYNKISIRTTNKLYEIDSVYLRKGEKLELSIDELHYVRHEKSKHIKVQKMDTYLTTNEKAIIRQTYLGLLPYTSNPQYFWMPGHEIHAVAANQRQGLVGPFYPNSTLNLVIKDEYKRSLYFESGFKYFVEPTRERLYENRDYITYGKIGTITNGENRPQVGQLMHTPSVIQTHTPYTFENYLNDYLNSGRNNHRIGSAKYQWRKKTENYTNNRNIIAEVWFKDNELIDINRHYNTNRVAGNYKLIYFLKDSTYFEHEIRLENSSLFFERFDFSEMKVDTNFTLLKSLMKEHRPNFKRPQKGDVSISSTTKPKEELIPYTVIGKISGKVTEASTGEALIGVTVMFEGTKIGTFTDIDGNFSIEVPSSSARLVFSYTGYGTQKINVSNFNYLNVALEEGVSMDEVVVVGYGSVKRKVKEEKYEAFMSTSSIEENLQGTVAGVQIARNNRRPDSAEKIVIRGNSSIQNGEPLYIVDGVPQKENPNLNPDEVAKIEVLKDAASTAVYGARGANGVIIITTKKGAFLNQELSGLQIRSEFKDYAYWQPSLLTDKNGEVHFNIKFPDNITQWNTTVLGMDRKSRVGITKMQTKAFKPVMGQLAIPRFLVEGDKVNIIGKSINFTNDSFQVNTQFKLNDEIIQSKDALLTNAIIEKTKITAPEPMDSLKLTYLMQTDKFGDGEERSIPVFRIGIEESKGYFFVLDKDTTITMKFDELDTDVQLTAQSNILKLLLKDIEGLKNYPYGCNEQSASRMIALLLDESVKRKLGESVNNQKEINAMIVRLTDAQNSDGSYGWWKNGSTNPWMTNYVLNALHLAKTRGYTNASAPLQKGIVYITNVGVYEKWNTLEKLEAINLLTNINQNANYERLIAPLDTLSKLSFYERLLLTKIKQHANLTYDLVVLDASMKTTLFGGAFFGTDGYHWYNNSIPTTLLAYEIYKKAGKDEICRNIRQYFMEKRRHYGWRNTFETARILHTILPDVLEGDMNIKENNLVINDNQSVTLDKERFQATYKNTKELTIKKTGNTPVFITAYQTFHNPKPTPKSDIFAVSTTFEQNGKKLNGNKAKLKQNEPVSLTVTVDVKKSADYVMIEIPIPAGCSYESKKQSYRYYEVHREHFKNKTSIFCQHLPIGKHTFTIQLEPRYTGDFTLNAAKAEQMYFPIFYGRNTTKKVEISE